MSSMLIYHPFSILAAALTSVFLSGNAKAAEACRPASLAIDTADGAHMLALTGLGLIYESVDGGESWVDRGRAPLAKYKSRKILAGNFQDPIWLFVPDAPHRSSLIMYSPDLAGSWNFVPDTGQKAVDAVGVGHTLFMVNRLEADPIGRVAQTYLRQERRVPHCTDGPRTWCWEPRPTSRHYQALAASIARIWEKDARIVTARTDEDGSGYVSTYPHDFSTETIVYRFYNYLVHGLETSRYNPRHLAMSLQSMDDGCTGLWRSLDGGRDFKCIPLPHDTGSGLPGSITFLDDSGSVAVIDSVTRKLYYLPGESDSWASLGWPPEMVCPPTLVGSPDGTLFYAGLKIWKFDGHRKWHDITPGN